MSLSMGATSTLRAAKRLEINTGSHESSVHTQGRTVLVIYTSEMHLIRYFWLLDTSRGTSVQVNFLAQGLLNHAVSAASKRQTLPSQMDHHVVGIACSLAPVGANRWSRPSPVEPARFRRPCDHLSSQELPCSVTPSSFGSTSWNQAHVRLILFFSSSVCSSSIQDCNRGCVDVFWQLTASNTHTLATGNYKCDRRDP